MNFLFFATSNFKPDCGGIAELGHQLAAAVVKAGHGVTVLAGRPDCQYDDSLLPYAVVRTEKKQPYPKAKAIINDRHPEALVVLVMGSAWRTARRLGKRYRIPVILYVHGLEVTKKNNIWPVFWAKQLLKGFLLKQCDLVLVNSFNTMLLAIKRGAVPERVRVLHPGVVRQETEEFLPGKKDLEGKFVFFSLGRLIQRKGMDQAIRALPQIVEHHPETLLVIAGSGPEDYRRELKELSQKLGVEKYVRFLDEIGETEKCYWYRRQDVFIMPSRQLPDGDVEGFGIVFLEAGMWEKPVIGGDSGGVSDAIEDGKSGLLVNPESVDSVAQGMVFFLDNPEKGVKMGRYGRLRALRNFSWDLQAQRFIQIIQNSVDSPKREEHNQWKDLPLNERMDKKIAGENLLIFKEILDGAGIPFILSCGTLLGAFRENDFIAHDTDTDVLLFESFREPLYAVLPQLEARGLQFVRLVKEGRVLTFYQKGEYLDVYLLFLKRIGLKKRWYFDYSSVSKNLLLNFRKHSFLGQHFLIPRDTPRVLRELYGKKWRIPIEDYEANHDYTMKLVRFLKKKNKGQAIQKFFNWISQR